MKRPFLAIGVSFAAAVWASFLWPALPLLPLSAAFALAGLSIFALRPRARAAAVVVLTVALALAHAHLYRQRAVLPLEQAVGQTVVVEGMVTQARRMNPGFALTVQAAFPDAGLPDATLRLRGYGEMEFLAGDGIRCLARLEPLSGSVGYYHSKGIFANARLLEGEPHPQLSPAQSAERLILTLRQRMVGNLHRNLNPETAGVISAMALGEWGGIARADRNAFAKAGTIHLLSVSGLHLSILVGCVTALLGRLGLKRRGAALGGMAGSLAFALLVGLSPSITRSLVMMLLTLSGRLFSRRSDSLNSMGLALLLIALLAPHWTLGQGLWLSCTSTAGIVVLSQPLEQRLKGFWQGRFALAPKPARFLLSAGTVAVSAYAFSFPVLLAVTGWVSLLTPVTNLLVAPLAAPALVGGMLCALFAPFPPAAWVTDLCVGLILSLSRLMASIPLLTFSLDEFWKLLWLLFGIAVAGLLLYWRGDRDLWRYGAALLVLTFAAGSLTLSLAQRDEIELVALEGCSPLILIREDSAVVVGTPSPYEIRALSRYLEFREIQSLDAVIAADCGEQISSGLLTLAADFPPGLVAGPDDDYILSQLERALPEVRVLSAGFARIEALGDAVITADSLTGEIRMEAGGHLVVKSGEKYVIITPEHLSRPSQAASGRGEEADPILKAWSRGVPIGTESTPAAFEPVGDFLFGERRLIFNTSTHG